MLGIDVVDVRRLSSVLARSPGLTRRFFTADERAYCESSPDPVLRFAGTLAAKEAVMKALARAPAPAWARRIEIVRRGDGGPEARVDGRRVAVSISHDAGVAVAVAFAPVH
jgi:holo-[acyl-carrier protein] synthase